jgi:hypothetical protein
LALITYGLYRINQIPSTTKPKSLEKKVHFSLSLTTFNYAEVLFTGELTYALKSDSFSISRYDRIGETTIVLFSKKIESDLADPIIRMQLDTLEDIYFNRCVVPTSGAVFSISMKKDTLSKEIYLRHYYHKQIEQLVIELNKEIPDQYKIEFMPSDTKQDCH